MHPSHSLRDNATKHTFKSHERRGGSLRLISNPFPHVCINGLGSRASTFQVGTIRETIVDDVITSTPKQIDNAT